MNPETFNEDQFAAEVAKAAVESNIYLCDNKNGSRTEHAVETAVKWILMRHDLVLVQGE